MTRWIAVAAGLVILAITNFSILGRERLLADGLLVLLETAPVDPRSLMQGDYMALRFRVADQVLGRSTAKQGLDDGHLVLKLDDQGVGQFQRFDEGTALAPGEFRMRYRIRDQRPKFATNAYFFQEGTAALYTGAKYGEFRVGTNGESILTGLRSASREPLGVAGAPASAPAAEQ